MLLGEKGTREREGRGVELIDPTVDSCHPGTLFVNPETSQSCPFKTEAIHI